MDILDEFSVSGQSGTAYDFAVYNKKSPMPLGRLVFLLGYRHPRGHRAGFHVAPLYLGVSDALPERLENLPEASCLRYELFNCVCVLQGSEKDYGVVRDDLVGTLDVVCGHD